MARPASDEGPRRVSSLAILLGNGERTLAVELSKSRDLNGRAEFETDPLR